MAKDNKSERARTFFLNERHELARDAKKGGGGTPKFGQIDWAAKGRTIRASLGATADALHAKNDPLKGRHFFMMALPVNGIPKISEAKGKTTNFIEAVDYKGREHSKVFSRLGIDLIDVTQAGNAVVHADPNVFTQLMTTTEFLADVSGREQARWSTIDQFGVIPAAERLDFDWLGALNHLRPIDVVFELQPILSSNEAGLVLRALTSYFVKGSDRFTGTGADYSGRQWARGLAAPRVLSQIAEELSSLQSIHPPMFSTAASRGTGQILDLSNLSRPSVPGDKSDLPTVAVLDNGIPAGHSLLATYSRGPQVVPRDAAPGYFEHHGSNVASRIVFGEVESNLDLKGECRFLDVRISNDEGEIHHKTIFDALSAVVAAYPDVRVFNLSIATQQGFDSYDTESRKEITRLLRDLDNFVFERDVLIAVAAGNSPSGQVPIPSYPNHSGDGRWRIGGWACGFNALVCGSFVGHVTPGALGGPNWPSPFTKIGPGVCDCPVPNFSAPGGNTDNQHRPTEEMGVLVCDQYGDFVTDIGTSLATPLLAREAALAMSLLKGYCPPGTNPFAATVRAFLTLSALPPDLPPNPPRNLKKLVNLTLGAGRASAQRLKAPIPQSAVIMWQGIISGPDEQLKLLLPIPKVWIEQATRPKIRVVAAWDTPVNDANVDAWACRRIELKLRPGVADGLEALNGSKSSHATYPLIERFYELKPDNPKFEVSGDNWLFELSYTEQKMADYYLGINPDPKQKVGLVAELYDESETPVSPQILLQSLPIANTMGILSGVGQLTSIPFRTN